MKVEPEFVGKTYNDFLIRPRMGVVDSRREVALTSPLTTRLTIELPVVSANMDSVTDASMAKAMALEGGIGFVHRAMPIEAQAREVARVKRTHAFVVEKPLCLPRDATIREARRFTREHDITGILIEEERASNRLAGLLSNRDIPWVEGYEDHRVDEFMTPMERLQTRPPDISVEEVERILFENRIEKLPLVDDDRRIRGLISKKDVILHRRRPYASVDDKGRLLVGAAIGARDDYLERAAELIQAGVDVVLIDIAHGHSQVMRRAVESFRTRFSDVPLVCGNIGTAEAASFLRDLGVDGIKVGVGPGHGCRTRLETAAGVPQLQAIREVWLAVEESVPIIADGGLRDDKDIFLALACGASSVMLGNMLAGTEETPGYVIEEPGSGQKRKIYRGMTSPQAVFQALYDAEGEQELETPAEGRQIEVPHKGTVVDVLSRIRGHLRSAVSYAGEGSLSRARAKIVKDPLSYLVPLSEAAQRESYQR